MPVAVKTYKAPSKQSSRFIKSNRGRSETIRNMPSVKKMPSDMFRDCLEKPTETREEGQSRLDCLEIAARVIEIHYPELPISKNLRSLVDDIQRYQASIVGTTTTTKSGTDRH